MSVNGFNIDGTVQRYNYNSLDNLPSVVSKPSTNPDGVNGQYLSTNGDGTTTWADVSGGSSGAANFEIAGDMTEFLATTADRVLVLCDDSDWGDRGQTWFEKTTDTEVTAEYGYERSDGSIMFPMVGQGPLPVANAPIREMMGVIKTWVGNSNVHHGDSSLAHTYTDSLFGATVTKDSDDLYVMDCAAFVSAIILGITYDHSRYVLGEDADNIYGEYVGDNLLANSKRTTGGILQKPKGGLNASEMAMWYAQRGRLFELPDNIEKAIDMLRFGDIIFKSTSGTHAYYEIDHVLFYLGGNTFASMQPTFSNVQSVNSTGVHEQQNLQLCVSYFKRNSVVVVGPGNEYQVFARPNYAGTPNRYEQPIIPIGNGLYTYDCFFLPGALTKRSALELNMPDGYIRNDDLNSTTPDYLPVIPESTIAYTGPFNNSRGYRYTIRIHEYDKNYGHLSDGLLAWTTQGVQNRQTVTLSANTKYIRFTIVINEKNVGIYLNDEDDFAVTITPPTSE